MLYNGYCATNPVPSVAAKLSGVFQENNEKFLEETFFHRSLISLH
jgi:hypothetical protein